MSLPLSLSPDVARAAVLAEAMTWIRTPWHHAARVKGAGVDCAQFLIAVYVAAGLIDDFSPDSYPPDWHLHRDEQRFMNNLMRYTERVDSPLPGDVAMFQYGRHAAHGSLVIEPDAPTIIHAWRDEGMVTITDLSTNPLRGRLAGFYRMKGLM